MSQDNLTKYCDHHFALSGQLSGPTLPFFLRRATSKLSRSEDSMKLGCSATSSPCPQLAKHYGFHDATCALPTDQPEFRDSNVTARARAEFMISDLGRSTT